MRSWREHEKKIENTPIFKIVLESHCKQGDIEQAIRGNNYVKKYYLEENILGKVETNKPQLGLAKFTFLSLLPPFDDFLKGHFRENPKVIYEIKTPPILGVGAIQVSFFLFTPPGILDRHGVIFYDKYGKLMKKIETGKEEKRKPEKFEDGYKTFDFKDIFKKSTSTYLF